MGSSSQGGQSQKLVSFREISHVRPPPGRYQIGCDVDAFGGKHFLDEL